MTTLLLASLLAQPQTTKPNWAITAASLFKNGYGVVFREAATDGKSDLYLPLLNGASLGTLWFTASPGVKIKSLVNTTLESDVTVSANSLADVLRLNKGKVLAFETFLTGDKERQKFNAKILDLYANQVLIEVNDRQETIPTESVLKLASPSGDKIIYQSQVKSSSRALKFTFEPGSAGKVYVMALQPGLSWSPAYAVNLVSDTKLKLTGKSVITNNIGDLSKVEVRLVTGFPHLAFLGQTDPMSDVMALLQPGGPGGFGGTGGAPGAFANQASGRFQLDEGMSGSFVPSGGGGSEGEDLFFYRQPDITLKNGDRGYYVLFENEAEYRSVYRADLANPLTVAPQRDATRPDVWHTLEFQNPAGQPLTTGPATSLKSGQIVGQDMINYTPAKGKVSLKVNKALDVMVDQSAEEVDRVRGALKDRFNNVTHDLVTLEGKVQIKNLKSKDVEMEIEMPVDGEVTAAEATVAKQAAGLRQINPRTMVTWRLKMKSGESKTLGFSAKVYVGV